jgi:hypothetical protein
VNTVLALPLLLTFNLPAFRFKLQLSEQTDEA